MAAGLLAALAMTVASGSRARATDGEVSLVSASGGYATAVAVDATRVVLGLGAQLRIAETSVQPSAAWLGTLLPGRIQDIALADGLVYVVSGAGGLNLVDARRSGDGNLPMWTFPAPWHGLGLAAGDGQVYVAAGRDGIRVIDVRSPDDPHELGAFDPAWEATAITVVGATAYVGAGVDGLYILDVSRPEAIAELGHLSLMGDVVAVAVDAGQAYLAAGSSGLRVVDVSDPAAPRAVGALAPGWQAEGIAVTDRYAYVAAGENGMRIVERSDPARPVEVASYLQADCCVHAVEVRDGQAYLAAGPAGLQVVDLGDPHSPVEVGRIDTPVQAIDVRGRYAYIATGALEGLWIFDVIDPTNAQLVGGYTIDGFVHDVQLDGRYAFLAAGQHGLRILDVTNPVAPIEAGVLPTAKYADFVTVSGRYAYLTVRFGAQDYELVVIDVTNRWVPEAVGSYTPGFMIANVVVSDSYAYVVAGDNGLRILDVRRPRVPLEVAAYNPSTWVSDVAVADGYAYVATQDGLRVVDVREPTTPIELGQLDGLSNAQSVVVDGTLVYLTVSDNGLRIVDVADPGAPREIGGWRLNPVVALAVSQGFAYAAQYGVVHVIDVHDPTNPAGRAMLETWRAAGDIDVEGWTAYIAAGQDGLYAFDIRPDRIEPVLLGSFDPPWPVRAVDVAGRHAYVAAGPYGLRVLDVGDPARILELGANDTPDVFVDSAEAVQVAGSLAYTGWFWRPTTIAYLGYLRIFDVANPTAPVDVGALQPMGPVDAVAVAGRYVLIGGGSIPLSTSWLKVVDALDLQHPVEVGHIDTSSPVTAIALAGRIAYATTADGHLKILDLANPTQPVEIGSTIVSGEPARRRATDVAVLGRYAYVAAGAAGLRQVDVGEPGAPRETAAFDRGWTSTAVVVTTRQAYLATDDGGLQSLRFANATAGLGQAIYLPRADR